jgi:hypothetical protein
VTVTDQPGYDDAHKAQLPSPEEVAGVGDDAVRDGTLDQFLVRVGDRAIGITWGGAGIDADRDRAVALARAAIARL